MPSVYLDASALVKLLVEEDESAALRQLLRQSDGLVTSVVSEVEVPRAARRSSHGARAVERARLLLDSCDRVALTGEVIEAARALDPPGLRTLDAIHLASALSVRTLCEELVAYDEALAEAGRAAGLRVATPGRA